MARKTAEKADKGNVSGRNRGPGANKALEAVREMFFAYTDAGYPLRDLQTLSQLSGISDSSLYDYLGGRHWPEENMPLVLRVTKRLREMAKRTLVVEAPKGFEPMMRGGRIRFIRTSLGLDG